MALSLPVTITSKKDVLKLRREIERVSEGILQKRVAEDKAHVKREVPSMGKQLRRVLEANDYEATEKNFQKLDKELEEVYKQSPQVRVAFAGEPDQASLEKLTGWFRKEAHPHTFVQVGIQPMLAGGAVVRTPKNRYDFSIRTALLANVDKLREAIKNVGQ